MADDTGPAATAARIALITAPLSGRADDKPDRDCLRGVVRAIPTCPPVSDQTRILLARFKPLEGSIFFAKVKAFDFRLNKVTGDARHDL